MGNLIEIDYVLVRQLRREGKWLEAQELVNAFQDNVKKNKQQQSKEILSETRKVIRTIKKKHGMCAYGWNCEEPPVKGKVCCRKHLNKLKKQITCK